MGFSSDFVIAILVVDEDRPSDGQEAPTTESQTRETRIEYILTYSKKCVLNVMRIYNCVLYHYTRLRMLLGIEVKWKWTCFSCDC